MKTLVKISAAFIICVFCISGVANAQQTAKQAKKAAKEAAVKKHIEERSYTFLAQYALPLRGTQRYLTSDYDLRITKDSVIAYLPYFGRVYMDVPMSPDEAGIKFTSTKFDYKIEPKKKGGWTIMITLNDVRRSNKLRLEVFTDGTSSLQVTSNTRDQISFTGYLKE